MGHDVGNNSINGCYYMGPTKWIYIAPSPLLVCVCVERLEASAHFFWACKVELGIMANPTVIAELSRWGQF